jgi:hypothetical protein
MTATNSTAGAGNLTLWDQLEPTDRAYTKEFKKGGFTGTAINPCYVAKRLTEVFGPVGVGWRFVLEDEKYVPGHTLPNGVNGDRAIVHVVRGHLEYFRPAGMGAVMAGKGDWLATGPQYGQTMFVGENSRGCFTDEEAPKKSITDCLSKCAVQLGLSADIHLGLWDDNKWAVDSDELPANKPRRSTRKTTEPAEPTGPPIESPVWNDIASADTPQRLAEVFDKARGSARLYDVPAIWEVVCDKIAGQFRAINLPDDPASKHVLHGLQQERARLDAGKESAGNNETAKKPRGRAKAAAAA